MHVTHIISVYIVFVIAFSQSDDDDPEFCGCHMQRYRYGSYDMPGDCSYFCRSTTLSYYSKHMSKEIRVYATYDKAGYIDLELCNGNATNTSKPIVLYLTSYDPIHWIIRTNDYNLIDIMDSITIEEIYVEYFRGDMGKSSVDFDNETSQIITASNTKIKIKDSDHTDYGADEETNEILYDVKRRYNQELYSFCGKYSGDATLCVGEYDIIDNMYPEDSKYKKCKIPMSIFAQNMIYVGCNFLFWCCLCGGIAYCQKKWRKYKKNKAERQRMQQQEEQEREREQRRLEQEERQQRRRVREKNRNVFVGDNASQKQEEQLREREHKRRLKQKEKKILTEIARVNGYDPNDNILPTYDEIEMEDNRNTNDTNTTFNDDIISQLKERRRVREKNRTVYDGDSASQQHQQRKRERQKQLARIVQMTEIHNEKTKELNDDTYNELEMENNRNTNNTNTPFNDEIISEQRKLSYSAMSCVICLDILLENESTKLKCGHKFHTHCIEEYNETKSECPLCRRKIEY